MPWTQDQMAARAAQELEDGFYVNLGIGIPTLVANFTGDKLEFGFLAEHYESDNGLLGASEDPYWHNETPAMVVRVPTTTTTETK